MPLPHLLHRKRPITLKWEITLAIIVKVILLYVIWALFFDQPVPKEERADIVTRAILNKSTTE